jgi:hypothetical protein
MTPILAIQILQSSSSFPELRAREFAAFFPRPLLLSFVVEKDDQGPLALFGRSPSILQVFPGLSTLWPRGTGRGFDLMVRAGVMK